MREQIKMTDRDLGNFAKDVKVTLLTNWLYREKPTDCPFQTKVNENKKQLHTEENTLKSLMTKYNCSQENNLIRKIREKIESRGWQNIAKKTEEDEQIDTQTIKRTAKSTIRRKIIRKLKNWLSGYLLLASLAQFRFTNPLDFFTVLNEEKRI